MKTLHLIFFLPFLAAAGSAHPTLLPLDQNHTPTTLTTRTPSTSITAAQLLLIAPSSSTCANAAIPSECRTATQAAPHISASFSRYQITSRRVQAALVATMVYESASFAYNTGHYPSHVPGKGTRNMQSYKYNSLYANDLFGAQALEEAAAVGPDQVLALVTGDEASFGSAAWFLASQCGGYRAVLREGTDEAYQSYLEDCVGTSWDGLRGSYYHAALEALGG
ncbi:hypothetical protein K490DRAFT_56133 [Saccharata proteae CBS 121410]|uniref:Uncharacterized protein n=1 Tax=Saccharata proteae CBS 121410 TaxID=1314787 RepID=A0A9P4HZK8_9PEZI|nr:hypothetical protein K490DRAFT_56133 [Saccharata proteae CBS 121410]